MKASTGFTLCMLSLTACPTDQFMLVYPDTGGTVEVRYLDNTGAWKHGSASLGGSTQQGTGAAAFEGGPLRLAAWSTSDSIEVAYGLGPEIWDGSASAGAEAAPSSGPVLAVQDSEVWFVAYRTASDTLELRRYEDRDFSTISLAPTEKNLRLIHRPGLALGHDKIVASWVNPEGVFVADSPLTSTVPTWNIRRFELPESVDGQPYGIPVSGPALASSRNRFLLAIARRTSCANISGNCLERVDALIYQSTDATSWSFLARKKIGNSPETSISIAESAKGDILVVHTGTTTGASGADLYSDGTWSTFDYSDVFGSGAKPGTDLGVVGL